MQWNKKLKAYTLSEIIVVLVLTSIVVGLALSVLKLVQKQMSALRINNENKLQLKSLETRLHILFHQSKLIKVENDKLWFYRFDDSISAQFYNNSFIIESDTLDVLISNPETYFKGGIIKNGHIDALLFEVELNKNIYKPLFVHKTNDARTNLNLWE